MKNGTSEPGDADGLTCNASVNRPQTIPGTGVKPSASAATSEGATPPYGQLAGGNAPVTKNVTVDPRAAGLSGEFTVPSWFSASARPCPEPSRDRIPGSLARTSTRNAGDRSPCAATVILVELLPASVYGAMHRIRPCVTEMMTAGWSSKKTCARPSCVGNVAAGWK